MPFVVYNDVGADTGGGGPVPGWLESLDVYRRFCQCNLGGKNSYDRLGHSDVGVGGKCWHRPCYFCTDIRDVKVAFGVRCTWESALQVSHPWSCGRLWVDAKHLCPRGSDTKRSMNEHSVVGLREATTRVLQGAPLEAPSPYNPRGRQPLRNSSVPRAAWWRISPNHGPLQIDRRKNWFVDSRVGHHLEWK